MDRIDSRENPRLTACAKLKEKKYRSQYGVYLIEGEKMVREALSSKMQVETVFVRGSALPEYDFLPEEKSVIVADHAFNKLCDTVTPQGIAATVRLPENVFTDPRGNCLILDGIRDAGNLGAIIRTAAATDITDIYLVDCADAYNPKCVRSSMSGIYYVKPMTVNAENALSAVRRAGLAVVAADMNGADIFKAQCKNFALVIGSEAHGVSGFFRRAADLTVKLPMHRVESLNAAVCAGVMMYVLTNTK